jgi:3-hydroxybutyryl-CoA dehydratase
MAQFIARDSFSIGEKASISHTVTEDDIATFGRLSGDYNPVHFDEEYARTTRFGGRIAHGILAAAFVSAVLGTKLPGPGAIYLGQTYKFTAPVRIGDTVTAAVEVTAFREDKRIVTLKTECSNQRGEVVLTGEAVLLMDKPAQYSR